MIAMLDKQIDRRAAQTDAPTACHAPSTTRDGSDECFTPVDEVLEELRAGRLIVLVDDERRENEGDLVVAAEKVTPEAINFMVRNGCGILGLALSQTLCERLHLEPLPTRSVDPQATPWTPHIDARIGITTGTSAHDRARTVLTAIDERSTPVDIVVGKGHVPCLRAREGGVLVRAGHTEGSTDLARLAGLKAAAVICEIMTPQGQMARVPALRDFSRQHHLKMCSIDALIKHRLKHEELIKRELTLTLPTRFGAFELTAYTCRGDPEPHFALCMGDRTGVGSASRPFVDREPVLVRIHSPCTTGELFGSTLCDCGAQLERAMAQVAARGRGIILYMRPEGRGGGLLPRLQEYRLRKEEGHGAVAANTDFGHGSEVRQYGIGAQIIRDLGVRQVRLLTNEPRQMTDLEEYGIRVVERVSMQIRPNSSHSDSPGTRSGQLGHLLDEVDWAASPSRP